MERLKPFLTVLQQIDLVESRGLIVEDRAALESFLLRTNYYRFSGYARQFQQNPSQGADEFIEGASANEIMRVMELDSRLRLLLFRAIAEIEVRVRSLLAHEMARVHGNDAFYLRQEFYVDVMDQKEAFIGAVERDLLEAWKPTVSRYAVKGDDGRRNYSAVPIWVAIEVLSFGKIIRMLNYVADKGPVYAVASHMSVDKGSFPSVMHSLQTVRNRCAHHAQLWHRKLDIQCPVQPKKLKRDWDSHSNHGLVPAIMMLQFYLVQLGLEADWGNAIAELLAESETFSDGILKPFAK